MKELGLDELLLPNKNFKTHVAKKKNDCADIGSMTKEQAIHQVSHEFQQMGQML